MIALVEAALWLLYGGYVDDPALLAGGASGIGMAAMILARLAWTGHEPSRGAWVPA